MNPIVGRFRIESDIDGSFYRVIFTPDRPQIWAPQPNRVTANLKSISDVEVLVGMHRERELRQARVDGAVEFTGQLSRELYEKYAQF
jgi:hypothetical protein